MENTRYPYIPFPERPVMEWPNQARLAVWIIPNIEHYRFDDPELGSSRRVPDVPAFSERDYGNRVGVWRLMDVLDRHHLRATVALNADICEHEPQIITAGNERGWEWMAHGLTNSQSLPGLEIEQERALIHEAVDTIAKATGAAPRGWLGPGRQENFDTPDLLAEAGIEYVVDWSADDLPIPLRVKSGRLLAMPYSGITDMSAFAHWHWSGEQFYHLIRDQFDMLYEEGRTRPRALSIALHPYLSGRPHRALWLDKALAYVADHDDVWLTTGGEIANWYFEKTAQLQS